EQPTIAGLGALVFQMIKDVDAHQVPPIERVDRTKELPLSFAQQRLWFLAQLDPESAAYNIPGVFDLIGSLDVTALASTFAEIIKRHEVLRTVFKTVEGRPLQVILPAANFKLGVVDLSGLNPADRQREQLRLAKAEARAPFDLASGPLLRTLLLRLS